MFAARQRDGVETLITEIGGGFWQRAGGGVQNELAKRNELPALCT